MELFWTLLNTGRIDLELDVRHWLDQRRVNSLKGNLICYWVLTHWCSCDMALSQTVFYMTILTKNLYAFSGKWQNNSWTRQLNVRRISLLQLPGRHSRVIGQTCMGHPAPSLRACTKRIPRISLSNFGKKKNHVQTPLKFWFHIFFWGNMIILMNINFLQNCKI